jgi:hypothetical protein
LRVRKPARPEQTAPAEEQSRDLKRTVRLSVDELTPQAITSRAR